jgi:hypothetical protein
MIDETLEATETLGELQHELDRILAIERKKHEDENEADRCYEQELTPVLHRVRDYLNQLIKLLNDKRLQQSEKTRHLCMPEVEYHLAQIGASAFGLIRGRQMDYHIITSNKAGRLADFSLYYQCTTESPVAIQHVEFRHPSDCTHRINLQERLKEYSLKYECVERPCEDGSVKMLFTLQPVVRVKFEFVGNPDGKSFQLTITNAGGTGKNGVLGKIHFPCITTQQVGVEAIEALIQYIVRQPSKLHRYWEAEKDFQQTEVSEVAPLNSMNHYDTSLQQTYDFDGVKAVDILARIQKQSPPIKPDANPPVEKLSKAQESLQESIEEYSRRVEQEHHKYMAELEKIRFTLEKGHSENLTLFSWATALLFSKSKQGKL